VSKNQGKESSLGRFNCALGPPSLHEPRGGPHPEASGLRDRHAPGPACTPHPSPPFSVSIKAQKPLISLGSDASRSRGWGTHTALRPTSSCHICVADSLLLHASWRLSCQHQHDHNRVLDNTPILLHAAAQGSGCIAIRTAGWSVASRPAWDKSAATLRLSTTTHQDPAGFHSTPNTTPLWEYKCPHPAEGRAYA
jgi:hypothetical protein